MLARARLLALRRPQQPRAGALANPASSLVWGHSSSSPSCALHSVVGGGIGAARAAGGMVCCWRRGVSTSIILKNLPPEIKHEHVREALAQFGQIENLRLVAGPSRGPKPALCFVQFRSSASAMAAVDELDKQVIYRTRVRAEMVRESNDKPLARRKRQQQQQWRHQRREGTDFGGVEPYGGRYGGAFGHEYREPREREPPQRQRSPFGSYRPTAGTGFDEGGGRGRGGF